MHTDNDVRTHKMAAIGKPRRDTSGETKPADIFICLRLLASRAVREYISVVQDTQSASLIVVTA